MTTMATPAAAPLAPYLGADSKDMPTREIAKLLFSHASLKLDLRRIRGQLFEQWVLLMTRVMYLSIFDDERLDDEVWY